MMHYLHGENRDQQLPKSLEQMVKADSWARVVDAFVDALPMLDLGFTNSKLNKEGNLPYHPADLFKLLLYGYRNGIRSANKLAEACHINIEVMWLLKGLQPSPRTINYFRANNTQAIEKAHRHFIQLLKHWRLIDGQVMALDGTRVRGQNSLKNNFNAAKIKRHLDYIDAKMDDYLHRLDELEELAPTPKTKRKEAELETKLGRLDQRKADYQIIEQQVKDSADGQVSLTDPDARAVIRHRGIVEVGYNIQTTVDARYKLVVDVFAGGVNDLGELGKAAQRAQKITGVKYIDLLADKGYHNGIELAYAERRGVRPFVAVKEQKDQKTVGFRKKDFSYDTSTKTYTCPAGHQLTHELTYWRNSTKKAYRVKRFGTKQCANCPLRSQCTTSSQGRKIERPMHQAYTDRNDKRVKRYPDFYRTRQEIIEHVFGTWKRHWGMPHVVVKGKKKVEAEFRLTAICYNLCRSLTILGWENLHKSLKALLTSFKGTLCRILSLLSGIFFQILIPSLENRSFRKCPYWKPIWN